MQFPVCQFERRAFFEAGARSHPFQKIETEIGAQRLFHHLIITLARSRRGNFGCPQQVLFEVHSGLSLHILSILTENLLSFKSCRLRALRSESVPASRPYTPPRS